MVAIGISFINNKKNIYATYWVESKNYVTWTLCDVREPQTC